jgi:hypothetical protein
MFVQNSSGTEICRISSITSPLDDEYHTVFASYDGDNGLATFYIDAQDADDTGNPNRTLTTGTLATSSASLDVSSDQGFFGGDIGYMGMRDAYLTNWSDFMEPNGRPKELDEIGWTEWGAQPVFWNEDGEMDINLGSAGNMVENGTIVKITPPAPAGTSEWHDVLEEGTVGVYENYLLNSTGSVGQVLGSADVSVAEDDGAGEPLGGTVVTKTIDFIAELTGSNLTMTTIPWILECIRVQEDAIIHVLTTPIESEGEAFVTGNECNQEVIREIYAQEWNSSFTVQVDQISGDAISGPDLGVELTTDVRRTWFIEATADGEDFNAVIDLTISDGTASVTKRITLHVKRTDESTDPGSDISTDFTQFDSIKDLFVQPDAVTPLEDTLTEMTFYSNGEVIAYTNHPGGPYVNFPQVWNVNSPTVADPENYEIRCTMLQGDDIPDGDVLDMWLNLSSTRTWQYRVLATDFGGFLNREIIEFGEFTFEIREVGFPDTVQTKRIFMQCGISPFEFDQTGDQ